MQQSSARYLDPNYKPETVAHLWDLDQDCLTELSTFLNIHDLKNLAQTNKLFLDRVSPILFDRWRKIGIDTIFVDIGQNTDYVLRFPTSKHAHVSHQSLRIFGKYVKKLHCSVRDEAIISGLLKFCPNLEELTLERIFNNLSGSDTIFQPLIYLKKLRFIRGELSNVITQFSSWCPNIHHLEFEMIYNMGDRDCINFHFPNLKYFVIESASPFKTENIQKMINKNPQIQVLQVDWPHFDGESFNYLCNSFDSLEIIKIRLIHGFEPIFTQEQFHKLKSVREVGIDCWHHWSSTLSLVTKYFPNINQLTIKLLDGNGIFIPTDDIESFNVMPNLKELNIEVNVPRDDQLDLLLRISSKIPQLTNLKIRSNVQNRELLNKCFVNFGQLQELTLSGRITEYENEIEIFNADFHRQFNLVSGSRDAAKMNIDIETSDGAKYNVNKQYIFRNDRIICKKLSYGQRV